MKENFKTIFQNVILNLYKKALEKGCMNIENNWNKIFDAVKIVIETTDNNSKQSEISKDEFFLNNFDPTLDYSLEMIFKILPKYYCVDCTKLDLNYFNPFSNSIPIMIRRQINLNIIDKKEDDLKSALSKTFLVDDIQKKIIPQKDEIVEEDKCRKNDLILIATLIDSPANLGGLTRTCEIYGVNQLILSDIKIIANKEFKSLSLSSEKWVHITERKEKDLIEYLLNLKTQGYTLIGLEQTTNSQNLDKFIFPKRCVLLLG